MRQSISPLDARRLLAGGPVALVTTAWRGNHNVMPAALFTPISFDPPLIGLAVHPARHTHDMIRYSEEFAINVPSRELLHHCQYLGSMSGRDANKLELTGLPTFRARHVDAPLLEGCVAYIECGVEDSYTVGDHTLFIGKVVAAQAEEDAFDGTWLPGDLDQQPLHYLGMNYYSLLGERLEARIPTTGDEETSDEQREGDQAALREQRERDEEDEERRLREGRPEDFANDDS